MKETTLLWVCIIFLVVGGTFHMFATWNVQDAIAVIEQRLELLEP